MSKWVFQEPAGSTPKPAPGKLETVSVPQVPVPQKPQVETAPQKVSSPEKEFLSDWVILGFVFNLVMVILFLFVGVSDANIAYEMKYFFQYIVLGLTVSMLLAGIIEWVIYKKRKVGYFSIGMVVFIIAIMIMIMVSSFVPALLPVTNAILANDGPYTMEFIQDRFNNTKAFYLAKVSETAPGSALNAIYSESAEVGIKDIEFFESLLGEASVEPLSGEKLFALEKASETSISSLSVAVSKFGSIDAKLNKSQLEQSIKSNPTTIAFIKEVSEKSIVIDEAKLGSSSEELKGKYPNSFWINSKQSIVSYLAKYLSLKSQSLNVSLDKNSVIKAFIEAQQLDALEKAYGK